VIRTALERVLVAERERRQADVSARAGFAVPGMLERVLDPDQEPLLVTNMRGGFVPTRVSRDGVGRCGFSECLPEEESRLLAALWGTLWGISVEQGWSNRCGSISSACRWMKSQGFEARSVVVSYELIEIMNGQDSTRQEMDRLMAEQGYVTLLHGVQIVVADIPVEKSFVAAAPSFVGYYTRSDDRLGVMLTRVDRALCLVDSDEVVRIVSGGSSD